MALSLPRTLLSLAPILIGLFVPLLSGCEDRYSEDLRYPLRTDPIIDEPPTVESLVPDRPGVLPVLSMTQMREPEFPLHSALAKTLDPEAIKGADRQALTKTLETMFGTPARPHVRGFIESDELPDLPPELRLDNRSLRMGSRLYRVHCLHCHGLPGDGRGPTAFWVNPHPRDYRKGIFKFVSTSVAQGTGQKPRRDDLMRVLKEGIEGTSMPSFGVLSDAELEAMTSYVIHLSMRGEVEAFVMRAVITGTGLGDSGSIEGCAKDSLTSVINYWQNSQKQAIEVRPFLAKTDEEMKASVGRGHALFMDEKNGCVKCHPNYGRDSTFRFDTWGTEVRPANLTNAIYRGGRRPIDLYYRVHGGINGSGMVGFADQYKVVDNKDALWDVVNFVQMLPYPAMRAKYGINID